ncbi:DUF418 domain-containing protein [Neobacillus sp. K501]
MIPIEGNRRIEVLDYLRGFALLGIILVNIIPLLAVGLPAPGSVDASYQRFLFLFVEGRFYTLFSFLFGVGFYLFISRANAKGKNGYILFLRRLVALFVFGFIHVKFHPGEALTVYAAVGFILLPFYKVNKWVNLIISLLLLLVSGVLGVKVFMVIPLILLGIAVGQFHFFENINDKTKKIAIFTAIILIISVVGLIYQYKNAPSLPFEFWGGDASAYLFKSIGIMIGPLVSALYVGLLILLLQIPLVQRLLSPLKNYGRMALTNYVSQTLLIYLAGNLFQLYGQISYLQSLIVCIVIYVIQLLFTTIWLRYFSFGPLEWIWRMITYIEVPPMKKQLKEKGV